MTNSIILLVTLAFAQVATAVANAAVIPWKPMDMTEVRRIYEDQTVPDATVIKTLTQMLDQRISMSASESFGGKNPNFGYEYASLIKSHSEPSSQQQGSKAGGFNPERCESAWA